MAGAALAIMTRVPSPEGKSRLSGILTPEQRESLQWAFLLDTLDKAKSLPKFKCYVAATPHELIHKLTAAIGVTAEVIPQVEGDLGRRMLGVIRHLHCRGHSPVVLIGTDSPALVPADLLMARELLDRYQVVLGPAEDGGYYLIGMKYPIAGLFEGISWGTGEVLRQTLAACEMYSLTYRLLDSLKDVDRPEDLLVLEEQIKNTKIGPVTGPFRAARYIQRILNERDESSNG